MADENKTVAYRITLDLSDLIKGQENLTKSIEELRRKQLDLDATTDEGRKKFKEQGAELRVLEAQLKINQKAILTLTEVEKKNTDQKNFNNNSITQNRELLKSLTQEYIRIQKPTEEQTKKLLTLTNTLKAQESAIGNNVRNVGNYQEAFSNALNGVNVFGKGLGDLFKLILTNPVGIIITALTALFSLMKGFEPVFDFFERGLAAISAGFEALISGNNILEAADQAYQLAGAVQELEDAQRANNIETAKSEAAIKNLILQSKDRTQTEKERLAFLDEAGKLEEQNFQKQLAIAQEQQRIADAELARAENNGRANDEIRDKAAQAEINLINLQSQSADLQERISTRRNALIQAENDERTKAAEQRKKDIEKQEAEEVKRLETIKKNAEAAKKIFEDTTKAEFEFTQTATAIFYEQQQANLQENLANQLITQEEFEQQSLLIKQQALEAQLIALQDYQTTVGGLEDEIARKQIEIQNLVTINKLANLTKEKEAEKKSDQEQKKRQEEIKKSQLQFAQSTADIFAASLQQQGDFLSNALKGFSLVIIEALEKEILAKQTAAIASATIGALTTPDSILSFGSSGVLRAGILIGLIKAAFGIFKSQIAGFAGGGLSGTRIGSGHGLPIHRSNGDNRLATVKVGEVILNQHQQHALGGPSTFARIGVPGFAQGGPVISDTGLTIATANNEINTDANMMINAINRMRLVVSVEEITEVGNRLKAIETVTEL